MSVIREALVVPAIFLTVALLGGLRIAETVTLLPPPLVALVLGVVLVGTLVRGRAFEPRYLMNGERSALENISGAMVLITLFAASTQVVNLVTPERGLLHALFSVCLFVQLATTLAGVNGRVSLLRSLLVLLGSAFLLRFVVLESLYATDSGLLKRLVTTLMEGVSLGGIEYQPHSTATGYVAFLTLALYLTGLVLLPAPGSGGPPQRRVPPPMRSELVMLLMLAAVVTGACGRVDPTAAAHEPAQSTAAVPPDAQARLRDAALRGARVWHEPSVPIGSVDFAQNPQMPGGFQTTDEVSCRFSIQKLNGRSPKFHCDLGNGDIVKVKYGRSNGELPAEVAATRLVAALGFGADRMFVVQKVRCAGCPALPFPALKCLEHTGMQTACFVGGLDYGSVTEFDSAVIERPLDGEKIEAPGVEGWAWYELDRIDPASGGASRTEVDALRLLAVVLAHWDNKSENQRLLCLPGGERSGGVCATPLAMIQDLGSTFGPMRVDLHNWRGTPVWTNRPTCEVSMAALPYRGATFRTQRISEGGRQMLVGLLEQISDAQLVTLFTASRMTAYDQVSAEGASATEWARAFHDKVRQMREGPPCPE
jgi:hypothetical protein